MKNHRFLWLRNRTTNNRKCEKARNIKEKRTIEMFSTDYWCLVQEVQHYGDEAADLQANKTTLAPAGYDWVVQDAYDLQKKGESGGIITPIFSKAVQATTEYSADLNSLWQEAYVDCVTCGPDEFESKYEEYCQEYLDAGYQEILDEKASLIADGNVLVVK